MCTYRLLHPRERTMARYCTSVQVLSWTEGEKKILHKSAMPSYITRPRVQLQIYCMLHNTKLAAQAAPAR